MVTAIVSELNGGRARWTGCSGGDCNRMRYLVLDWNAWRDVEL